MSRLRERVNAYNMGSIPKTVKERNGGSHRKANRSRSASKRLSSSLLYQETGDGCLFVSLLLKPKIAPDALQSLREQYVSTLFIHHELSVRSTTPFVAPSYFIAKNMQDREVRVMCPPVRGGEWIALDKTARMHSDWLGLTRSDSS